MWACVGLVVWGLVFCDLFFVGVLGLFVLVVLSLVSLCCRFVVGLCWCGF